MPARQTCSVWLSNLNKPPRMLPVIPAMLSLPEARRFTTACHFESLSRARNDPSCRLSQSDRRSTAPRVCSFPLRASTVSIFLPPRCFNWTRRAPLVPYQASPEPSACVCLCMRGNWEIECSAGCAARLHALARRRRLHATRASRLDSARLPCRCAVPWCFHFRWSSRGPRDRGLGSLLARLLAAASSVPGCASRCASVRHSRRLADVEQWGVVPGVEGMMRGLAANGVAPCGLATKAVTPRLTRERRQIER